MITYSVKTIVCFALYGATRVGRPDLSGSAAAYGSGLLLPIEACPESAGQSFGHVPEFLDAAVYFDFFEPGVFSKRSHTDRVTIIGTKSV
jgi:hypothetical protein